MIQRFLNWKERFLRDLPKIEEADLEALKREIKPLWEGEPDKRALLAVRSMYVGGVERRVEDKEVRRWTNWAALKTYRTFNGFPNLSTVEMCFVFYAIGKLFVPLLLHERGVKSEAFKKLSEEEQEEAVFEELDTIWETQLTLILQALEFLDLKAIRK